MNMDFMNHFYEGSRLINNLNPHLPATNIAYNPNTNNIQPQITQPVNIQPQTAQPINIGSSSLESFYTRVMNTPVQQPVMKPLDLSDTPVNKDYFKRKIYGIGSMADIEVVNLIRECLDQIVNGILNNDAFFGSLVLNHKFLDAFTKVICSIPIKPEIRLCCNKLAYDYLTLGDQADHFIKRKMFNLSLTVNKNDINKLKTFGLNENTCTNLALARYSSPNEIVNVKRLNFTICSMDEDIMTEQMIIYIYETLFRHVSPLFEGTMFEWYTDEDEEQLGESFMNIYSTISLAVLTILNNMTSIDIRKVLIGYVGNWIYGGKQITRFSMRSLSNDFSRINNVVEMLKKEGTIVP